MEAANGRRGGIVLWGPPGSGKSTYLAALVLGTGRAAEESAVWEVMPADMAAAEFVARTNQAHAAGRGISGVGANSLVFHLQQRRPAAARSWLPVRKEKILREADLHFLDPKGDVYANNAFGSEAGREIVRRIQDGLGLMLLIDPLSGGGGDARQYYWQLLFGNIGTIVLALRERLAAGERVPLDRFGRLTLPVAVCLTKMDQVDGGRHQPQETLDRLLGTSVRLVKDSFAMYQVFAVSALGDGWSGGADGRAPLPSPWGILNPLKWIVDQQPRKRLWR